MTDKRWLADSSARVGRVACHMPGKGEHATVGRVGWQGGGHPDSDAEEARSTHLARGEYRFSRLITPLLLLLLKYTLLCTVLL